MSDELKPCPFCGRTEAKLTECHAGWAFGWHVTCKHCLSVGATAYSDRVGVGAKTPEEKEIQMKEYAVANWNHRTPSDHIVDTNKKVDDNPPLTLEELRGMDGSWVYIGCERLDAWAIVAAHYYDGTVCLESSVWGCREFRCNKSLDGITVYRRKPEEE